MRPFRRLIVSSSHAPGVLERMNAMISKLLLMSALIVGGTAVAHAQDSTSTDVPVCSKTITDKCMNPTAVPKKMKAMHHRKAAKKAAKPTAKTTG